MEPPNSTQRKTESAGFTSATSPPRTEKPSFNIWFRSASNECSVGAQRYADHARAGSHQWSKPQGEAQTRADASDEFRDFHGTKGSNTVGWRAADTKTGRATPSSGRTLRQQNVPFGNLRPKSTYESFKESMKSQGPASPDLPKKRN
ncbi:hypothetical protein NUU61_001552 [Penicillium alfredii]|uniref:Uncharacterized protein n=1 Tax=Penicillium alfredii TaxID=1506179 RepID=A0A9W9G5X2_9EURO|nr:uncharacterized protein NUU61_001552 [Penicillium alfredii]KAJ5111922.1 hypothetical protein NUU61_001552 [Penicillium alfredii]